MRQIKFKAISEDTKKWVFGYGVVYNEKDHAALIVNHTGNNLLQHNEVIPESICYFTGVKDKLGIDVYDGDIFEDNQGKHYLTWSVPGGFAFTTPAFGIKSKWPYEDLSNEQNISWFKSNCFVIGNINDNPELIK